MKKAYTKPKFQLIRQDESNKVFFAASGMPESVNIGISKMTYSTTDWL